MGVVIVYDIFVGKLFEGATLKVVVILVCKILMYLSLIDVILGGIILVAKLSGSLAKTSVYY